MEEVLLPIIEVRPRQEERSIGMPFNETEHTVLAEVPEAYHVTMELPGRIQEALEVLLILEHIVVGHQEPIEALPILEELQEALEVINLQEVAPQEQVLTEAQEVVVQEVLVTEVQEAVLEVPATDVHPAAVPEALVTDVLLAAAEAV